MKTLTMLKQKIHITIQKCICLFSVTTVQTVSEIESHEVHQKGRDSIDYPLLKPRLSGRRFSLHCRLTHCPLVEQHAYYKLFLSDWAAYLLSNIDKNINTTLIAVP